MSMRLCKRCGQLFYSVKREDDYREYLYGGKPHACPSKPMKPKPSEPINHRIGETITGQSYQPACGQCTALPWEQCSCSSRMAIELNSSADERLQLALFGDS